MTSHRVDWDLLRQATETKRKRDGLSKRALARQLGLAPASIIYFTNGRQFNGSALASLLAWLNPDAIPNWIKEATCPPTSPPTGSTTSPSRGSAQEKRSAAT